MLCHKPSLHPVWRLQRALSQSRRLLRDVLKTIILIQVINHATEHRSQIMTFMTQLGIDPPDLQGWAYFDDLED